VLDYPRIFTEEDVFAFRTLFWWGNYLSFTLHLKGKYLPPVITEILPSKNTQSNLYYSINGNEFNHNVHSEDYKSLPTPFTKEGSSMDFFKLVKVLNLAVLNGLDEHYHHTFRQFLIKWLN
jgi:hypothetical protein